MEPTSLTDSSSPAVYDANFSPRGGFYLLTYKGPQVPWQKVIQVKDHSTCLNSCSHTKRSLSVGLSGMDFILTENPQLNDTLSHYEMPVVAYTTIDSDGYGVFPGYAIRSKINAHHIQNSTSLKCVHREWMIQDAPSIQYCSGCTFTLYSTTRSRVHLIDCVHISTVTVVQDRNWSAWNSRMIGMTLLLVHFSTLSWLSMGVVQASKAEDYAIQSRTTWVTGKLVTRSMLLGSSIVRTYSHPF